MDLKILSLWVDVGTWSGTSRIDPRDLGVPPEVIPPKELASLGTLRIIDKEDVQPFDNLRKAAHREIHQVAVRYLGNGYGVPLHRVKELQAKLDELRGQYNELRGKILNKFEESIRDFASQHPKYAEVIIARAPTRAYLERQLRFRVSAAKLTAASDVQSFFEQVNQELWKTLLEEICADAAKTYEESFQGKTEVTQRALRPVKTLVDKLDGLIMLNGNLRKVSLFIHNVLDSLPKTGKINGSDLAAAQGLLAKLCTFEDMEKHCGFDADSDGDEDSSVDPALPASAQQTLPLPVGHPPAPDVAQPAAWI